MSKNEATVTFDTKDDGSVTGIRHANAAFFNAVSDELLEEISPNGKRLPADLQEWGQRLMASADSISVLHIDRDAHNPVVVVPAAFELDHAA